MPKQKPQKAEIVRVVPEFSPQFREDLKWWAKTNPRLWERLWDLIEAVTQDPFAGLGKPEPLKHLGSNLWSRRINLEHRLIYQMEQNRILFLQARYHYGDLKQAVKKGCDGNLFHRFSGFCTSVLNRDLIERYKKDEFMPFRSLIYIIRVAYPYLLQNQCIRS